LKPDGPQAYQEGQEGLQALSQSLRMSLIWLYVLIGIMGIVIVSQSFFVVKEHEIGLIYRFGELRNIVGNGLHFTWPYPIETTETKVLSRSRKIESSAFMHAPIKDAAMPETLRPELDGYLYTGDRNIVHAKCVLTYTIDSANQAAILSYFVNHTRSETTLKVLLDNAVLKAAAETSADDILFDVDLFRGRVASYLRQNIAKEGLGVSFESTDLSLAPSPPRQAKQAFEALSRASQEQDKIKNEALSYQIKIESAAKSTRDNLMSEAKNAKLRKVAEAKADAINFAEQVKQFERNPDLIYQTLYEETIFRILQSVDEKFIADRDSGRQIRVLLGRDMNSGKKEPKKDE